MKGGLWTLVVIAVALALLVPAINGAYDDEAPQLFSATESTTVDYDVNYTLANDTVIEYTSLTVTRDADGSTLDEGTDYLFINDTAEIDWQNTTATDSGDDVTIDYEFRNRTQTTEFQADILRPFATIIGLLFLVVAIAAGFKLTFEGF